MVRLAADCIVAYGIYWHGFRTSIAWYMIRILDEAEAACTV